MIRRDYLLRMIEDFMALLARLNSLKRSQKFQEEGQILREEFRRMTGSTTEQLQDLTETELLARVIAGEPTVVVRDKTLMLTALLKEAGEVAIAENRLTEGRSLLLKALNLVLQTAASGELSDWPAFVPRVESLLLALEDAPLPLPPLALLMQHYEKSGEYAKAEDMLFALADYDPGNPALRQLGEGFYSRLRDLSDAALAFGNLPRAELETGWADFRRKHGG